MRTKILVIGGWGFLGRRVMRALAAAGLAPVAAGRRADKDGVRIDLRDASTFGVMDEFDVIVDCADALTAPPAAAFDYCLRRGLIFVETTAEPKTTFELLKRRGEAPRRSEALDSSRPGLGVIGVGLFPGLSNLLARHLFETIGHGACHSLDVGVRLSPLSAAGPGMCALIADMVTGPSTSVRRGEVIVGPSFQPVARFPFADGPSDALTIALPESVMLHHSTAVANSRSVIAMRPGVLGLPLRSLGRLAPMLEGSALGNGLEKLLRWQLLALRAGVLRRVPTRVELSAVAHDALGIKHHSWLRLADGIGATAWLIAATVRSLATEPRPGRGTLLVDEVADLDTILESYQVITGHSVDRGGLEPEDVRPAIPSKLETAAL